MSMKASSFSKKIQSLPKSDEEYWDGAETSLNTPKQIGLCETHFKDFTLHTGYIDNHDGTISCKFCPWGTRLPGYMRVLDGRIVDFRG